MEDKLLKQAVLIKALTGIGLLGYRIYRCAVTSIALAVFPFMISCVVIVLLGFTVAALCEYFSSRRKDAMNLRRVARHLIEGVLLAVFIIIICVIINKIKKLRKNYMRSKTYIIAIKRHVLYNYPIRTAHYVERVTVPYNNIRILSVIYRTNSVSNPAGNSWIYSYCP